MKIILFYLSTLLVFKVHVYTLPLGIIISFIIVSKKSKKNKSIKKLTLMFSLITFVLINFIVPPISLDNIFFSREINLQRLRFQDIEYMKVFDKDSSIQEKIREYDNDTTHLMFRTFILMEKGIEIRDKEWLAYESEDKFDHYWSSHTKKTEETIVNLTLRMSHGTAWEEYVRDNKTGEEYLGFFERIGNKIYLKYVFKGKLKSGSQPKSYFN
ncbi:hypothetical protein [Wukongibacter baidiensis]